MAQVVVPRRDLRGTPRPAEETGNHAAASALLRHVVRPPRLDPLPLPMTNLPLALWLCLASAQPGEPLSLPQALAEAEQHAPEVAAVRAREATARAGILAAGALPPTALSFGAGQNDPPWSVGLSQKLPAFGARSARVDAASEDATSARLEALQAAAAARADARRAFFALVRAQQKLDLAEHSLALARSAEEAARARFEAGAAPRLDVVQARLTRAAAQATLGTQQAERAATAAELAVLLGRDPTRPLAPRSDGAPPLPTLDAVLAAAEKGPLAGAREAELRAARFQADAARAERIPSPTLGVSAEGLLAPATPLPGESNPPFALRATLDLEFPLFGFNHGEIAVADAKVEEARLRRDAAVRQRIAALYAAHQRLSAALDAAARYREEILPAADEAETTSLDAYRSGLIPLASLLEAQRSAAETRAQSVDAAFAAQDAFAQLETAAGVPLDAP